MLIKKYPFDNMAELKLISIPEKYRFVYSLNPVTPVINTFRYAYLGVGDFDLLLYLISWAEAILVLFIGILLFNRVERTFMDTV